MRYILLISLCAITLAGPLAPEQKELQDAGMAQIGDFYIDIYEYPNRKGALPRVNVTWSEAQNLCRARGKRLCAGDEWERACKGLHNYLYGYGVAFEHNRCNTPYKEGKIWKRGRGLVPSGSFGECTNDYGVYDMIGNVWEWTDAWYSPAKQWHVVRGGSWFHSANLARSDTRYGRFLESDYRLDLVGFRCCRSASETDSP